MNNALKFLFYLFLSAILLYAGYLYMLPEKPSETSSLETQRSCGGMLGLDCPIGYKCVYPEPMYPDAMGDCVPGREMDPNLSLVDLYDQFQAKSYEIKAWVRMEFSKLFNQSEAPSSEVPAGEIPDEWLRTKQ